LGILNEEAIRKNFTLVYELLDEIVDYGYPQVVKSELLKPFVYNTPVPTEEQGSKSIIENLPNVLQVKPNRTTPSRTANKTILDSGGKNELYLDLIENLTVTFSGNGSTVRSEIEGRLKMKSFLQGNPYIRLALNEDLSVGSSSHFSSRGVVLDSCTFHECVELSQWEGSRVLMFYPPEGEFDVMRYRIGGGFEPPFRLFPYIDDLGHGQVDVIIKIRADIPTFGNNVIVKCPVPKATLSVSCDLDTGAVGQITEYIAAENAVYWSTKKFMGNTEQFCRIKINLDESVASDIKKEIGPLSLKFEIPMHICSNLNVRYLRVAERNREYVPYRWVRSVTRTESYVTRFGS